jgi:hypothetical protein
VTRQIVGLRWVKLAQNPWPKLRLRGPKAEGIAYQHKVAKQLGLRENVWFNFEDANGLGYCSPDGLALHGGRIVVVECKLTQTTQAIVQLEGLYRPVVEHYYQKAMVGITVVRRRTQEPWPGYVANGLEEALGGAPPVLWHLSWPGATK